MTATGRKSVFYVSRSCHQVAQHGCRLFAFMRTAAAAAAAALAAAPIIRSIVHKQCGCMQLSYDRRLGEMAGV
jgi:hypothetical protein